MMRLLPFLILFGISYLTGNATVGTLHTYPTSYNACNGCSYQTTGSTFYDDGGKDGVISNQYQLTTFTARTGYMLSFYFTQIDIPAGAKINIYRGSSPDPQNKIETFTSPKKSDNIVAAVFTVEYVPSANTQNSRGWIAHIDEKEATPNLNRVMSQPESDCPYAIPLCANNTVIALGGLYNDLGAIGDDDGSCYGGTGSGGSVWYSFTPQSSGPIDFTIFPSGTTDYDFVLWDITSGCQSGKRNELACNYSLYTGTTGLSGTKCSEVVGTSDIDCGTSCGDMSKYADCNRFDNRVNVSVGRQYAICVNFYSGSNDGFTLRFQNEPGSVAITDVIPPVITNAYSSNCVTASNFHVTFSEWIDCSTLNNGDFTLAGHTFNVVTSNCFGNRTNNIDIAISPALTAGTYTVHTTGIKDLCGNMMNSDYNIVIGTPPTPAITPPALVCKAAIPTGFSYTPANQTLTASGGNTYYWYDGQTGPSATFNTTTPKTISVTVTKGGCSATASVNIVISSVAVSLGPDQYYCGTPVTLTASPAGAGNVYQFYKNPTTIPFSNGTLVQTGASNILSGLTPPGYTIYRVIVTNPNGCKAQSDVAVKTNPGTPQLSFPGFNYCVGAGPVLWTANPPGGVFSGPGMSNDTFYPSRAGVGTWTINYSLVTPCGTFSNSKTIKVSAGVNPTLGLNPTYCYNDTISHPIPNPKCGTYDGPGITTGTCTNGVPNPGFPNIFNPGLAGVGTHTYSYYNAGCASNQVVTIIGPGTQPVITGAAGPYCTTALSIVLTGTPAGGTFTGPGMTGSTFNPATAGPGTHTINYFYTKCGLNLDTSIQIQVNSSSPAASISYAGPFCSSLSTSQSVTRTGTPGGTYSAVPSGLTIDPSTGAITPNTSTPQAYTVTYSIAAGGGCPAFSTNTSVTITNGITPTFAPVGPLCQNTVAPSLPLNSNNATPISGTWSPSTINTSATGTITYTFTPNAGQCASTTTLNITITSGITPVFTSIGPLCQNSVAPGLPLNSTNAIAGTWSPSTINTTTNGTTTYTFTPNAGQCATTTTMNVTINPQTVPTFAAIGPLCQNSVAPSLPLNSTNAIAGTWSPSTINTTTNGTAIYTFTPNAGQCATTTTMNVTINPQTVPNFAAIGPLCQNSVAPSLPLNSTNAISGTWNPSTINTTTNGTTTYTFTPNAGQCATTTTMDVTITSQITPTFAAIGPLCQNSVAPALLINSTNAIAGTWNPSTINTTTNGTTTYTFTPNAGQCATTTTMDVTITSQITPTFAAIGPLCQNSVAPSLPLNSTNAIAGTWNPSTINTTTNGTTTYTFTPTAGQCATTTTMDVTITSQITPTFAAIGPLCQNSVAPSLPLNSTNAIAGTWSPSTINTTTNGTATYTFTPNAGQCATTTTMNVTINPQIVPTFAAIGPLCQNSVAPSLPLNSTNAIAGTWSPSAINTTTNGTTTYTFTPTAGQCATTTTLDVTINPQIVPTFAAIGPLCQNSVASSLPLNSTNAIAGTWSPSTINTTTNGTTTYTFTPNAGQCATTTTLDVTITSQITPTFAAIGPLCQNSVAPSLPLNSTNAITGTWSPSTINTTTNGTATYTFTPTAGQCATTTTLDVTITSQITPTFAVIGPLCQNSVAPGLPLNSTNAIAGTWSPSTINTTTNGTATYTFTPTGGQCATTTTLDVTIISQITPTFAAIGPLCQNSVSPGLPLNSTNAIGGTWSPSAINTTTNGTATYTFTPTAGQCATTTTLDVTINPQTVPTFAAIGPLCQNSVAPSLSLNSTNAIAGTWSPSTINTTTNGTTAYTFTPNAGQCATTTTMNVTINPQTVPTFAAIGPLCQNSVAPSLPINSTNAIAGTWSPSVINTTTNGTTTYTFTPNAGQCATTTTLDVTITLQITPTFAAIGPLCQNSVAPSLPLNSINAIAGTWSPSTINTTTNGTATYTFTPTAGQCATTTTLDVTITLQITPTFAAIGPLCQNSVAPALPLNSINAIKGTWNPSTINTTTNGTTTYTFTPTAGQCATITTLDVTINPQTVPTFAAIGPLCQNSVAPSLPLNSTNAIAGTWSPSTINTTTNGTATYTFTPTVGQCATTTTLDVTITSQITPTFAAIGPLCQNSVAPGLPLNSTNAIAGTWNPSTINTTTNGTTTYTFTPTAGQCATTTTLDVTINPQTVPTFPAIGPLCQNSVAPGLPLNSTNAIAGNWSPSTINTTTNGTTTYTFTPTAGQCATTTTLDVTITSQITPTFAAIGPLCQNSVAPSLPLNSTNAIAGTWSPSTINTTTNGTTTYTFTPTAGQCATTTTLDITINPQTVPTFVAIGPLCQNSVSPGLPLNSTNAIGGTWSPSTINTTTNGTATYTFTPTAGQCATTTTLNVTTNAIKSTNLTSSICTGQSVTVGSQVFNATGNYTILLLSSQGCDSTVNLALTVNPTKITNLSKIICKGQSVTIGSQTFTVSGNYSVLLQSSAGCDSTVNLALTVNPTVTTNISKTICQGGSVSIGSQTFSTTGNYNIVLQTVNGCDSTINLSLIVNPVKNTSISKTICQGASVTLGSQTFSASGNYSVVLQTSAGCDSTVNLSLTVNPVKTTNITKTICQGSSYTVGSKSFDSTGNYSILLSSSKGCDSTVNLSLTVDPILIPDVSLTSDKNNICMGDAITFTATPTNTGGAQTFQWYVNSLPVGSNSAELISSALNDGDSVSVSIITSAACAQPKTAKSNSIHPIINTVSYVKPSIEYCQNTSYTINDLSIVTKPDPNYIITWTNGSQITTDSTSQYTIDNTTSTVIPFQIRYGNNCKVNDQVVVKVNPAPVIDAVVDLPHVKYEQQVQLDVNTAGTLTYNWIPAAAVSNPAIKDPTSVIRSSTWFTVFVKDGKNCTNSDSVYVELIDECQEDYIYVPGAFSPNHDGVNDCFRIISPPQLTDFKMTIFNRWGEKVFESYSVDDCWDGTFRGGQPLADSYVYLISFKCYNGTNLSKKGTVILLR